MTTESRQ